MVVACLVFDPKDRAQMVVKPKFVRKFTLELEPDELVPRQDEYFEPRDGSGAYRVFRVYHLYSKGYTELHVHPC